MSESENESKGFKVTDRRSFTSDGERRADAEGAEPEKHEAVKREPKTEEMKAAESPAPESKAQEAAGTRLGPPPEVGFIDLINMLVTNALLQLGELPDPVSGERAENLQGVQVMIAFLTMLQEKTKGNLGENEAEVLEDVLYDLRMRFMAKANLIKT
jgi:hypothetical protein